MKKLVPRSFWMIVNGGAGRMNVLTANLAAGEEALPVFSFEDEARMFLELGAFDGDWRVRETGAGELISILCCLCASVDRVALDPLPGPDAVLNNLLSMRRGVFMEFAVKQGCGAPSAPIASAERAGQRPPDRPSAKNGRVRRSSQCVADGRPANATMRTATLERR